MNRRADVIFRVTKNSTASVRAKAAQSVKRMDDWRIWFDSWRGSTICLFSKTSSLPVGTTQSPAERVKTPGCKFYVLLSMHSGTTLGK